MSTVAMEQRKKIHPHKFTLWVGIGSLLMMFAGLTSAYIVKRNQANWQTFDLPQFFWYSTAAILLSSVTIYLAQKAFKQREMRKYRSLVIATLVLGVLFMVFQVLGFQQFWKQGLPLGTNVSSDFMYVIVGLHAAHVAGGLIALIVLFANAFNTKTRTYNSIPVELVSTYWHFVDVLWIYLLIFLIMIR
ncbi:MAG: heme-copper oxidase subunit III [Chitinophagaceae bacterium]|nr:heme-copper oxidase subunit III [Chitinophagaceae bacterium]MBK7307099.1 heme-copper oxidase subunit III [Chitinophagaceae bacterium]MBK8785351.1 heme-copper oxidase subunit III [Chitinophagaceae bacterium]MBK9484551.1 heme-copper oxidase subunit III [Chitinophagaceae bacterium]MBL0199135.1 heme-copper oxidase subunit III [Chitinophagaceae bacterium]